MEILTPGISECENRVITDVIIKMRCYWESSKTGILIKRGNLDTGRTHVTMKANRNVGGVHSQGKPEMPANQQKLRERPGTDPPHSPQKEPTLLIP